MLIEINLYYDNKIQDLNSDIKAIEQRVNFVYDKFTQNDILEHINNLNTCQEEHEILLRELVKETKENYKLITVSIEVPNFL